jgi:hypothetical protein
MTGGRLIIGSRWPPAGGADLAAAMMLAGSRPVSASPRSAGTRRWLGQPIRCFLRNESIADSGYEKYQV